MVNHWTPTMQDCYDRNCICEGCYIIKLMTSQHRCFVKKYIREYIRKHGLPDHIQTKKVIEE